MDTTEFTLHDLIKDVIKSKLGFVEPSIDVGSSNIFEEGDGASDSHKNYIHKKLCDCPAGGIKNGTIMTIEDFRQELKVWFIVTFELNQFMKSAVCYLQVDVVIKHVSASDLDEEKYPLHFSLEGHVAASAQDTALSGSVGAAETGDDDEVVVVDDVKLGLVEVIGEGSSDEQPPKKRHKH